MTNDFEILVVRSGPAAVVHVCGELDLGTAPGFHSRLASLVDDGVVDITVDLAELGFIDSSGLTALIRAMKLLRGRGGTLALRSPSPSTRRVFEITGLTRVFTLA